MLRVMYKNAAQTWLPIIMADVATKGDVPIHRARVVAQWFDECDTDVIHVSWPSQLTDVNLNRAFMGYSGTTPETAFFTSIK